MRKLRVAILISGRGSNMQALIGAAQAAGYPAEIVLVISNRPDAAGLALAEKAGVPTRIVDHKAYPSREEFDAALEEALVAARPDVVAFAGFMRILTTPFIERLRGKAVNIHPSLLPLYKGLKPQQQALDAGATESGCTVHWVTPGVDEGPIIAQARVPVLPGDTADTLAARILTEEHKLYPRAIAMIARGEASFPD
ncbi:MAG: phosphoribosylglycinamide formyltransferase [Alphaproteobacteria bacterium]|nr:phosphoribosylglycinamide formyltransferase [Alphaproteobacteria bacterium]